MNKNGKGYGIGFEFEEGVILKASRTPGTDGADVRVNATTIGAGLKGLSLLILEFSGAASIPAEHLLCLLAVQAAEAAKRMKAEAEGGEESGQAEGPEQGAAGGFEAEWEESGGV